MNKVQHFLALVVIGLGSSRYALWGQSPIRQIPDSAWSQLRQMEDSLVILAYQMVGDTIVRRRLPAAHRFVRLLIRALKLPGSYWYPFDSLRKVISIVDAPDGRFRIFSWEVLRSDGWYRHFGAIQLRSKQLKLIPLLDYSPWLRHAEDTSFCAPVWWGCTYYNIIVKRKWLKKYYFLFGWNWHDLFSNRKVAEVLWLRRRKGEIQACFGAPLFWIPDSGRKLYRFILEYKKDAAVTLNYNPDKKMIVYSYLVPLSPLMRGNKRWYVPEGTYDGFVWRWGQWKHRQMVLQPKKPITPPGTDKANTRRNASIEEELIRKSQKRTRKSRTPLPKIQEGQVQ